MIGTVHVCKQLSSCSRGQRGEQDEMAIDLIWAELIAGVPDPTHLVRAVLRLLTAMLVGAVIGSERQQAGQSAGLRTHMLVAMGGPLRTSPIGGWDGLK
jgi:MgtC family